MANTKRNTNRNTNNRSAAAKKAGATMRARRAFKAQYPRSYQIVADLIYASREGYKTSDVATWNMTSVHTVAAVLANLHREGSFRTMATAARF